MTVTVSMMTGMVVCIAAAAARHISAIMVMKHGKVVFTRIRRIHLARVKLYYVLLGTGQTSENTPQQGEHKKTQRKQRNKGQGACFIYR